MNLLLDTHTLLWWLGGAPLDPRAVERIADPSALVVVSAASIWEAEIKRGVGKLTYPGSLIADVEEAGFTDLPISFDHAERAGTLPPHHRDPFDRMLIAQAQVEGLAIVTRDPAIGSYDVAVVAC